MGEKLEEYMDYAGNTVRDDDIVVYEGREYRVAYISHLYVNLDGGRGNWRHLPFHVGVPERKISNAPSQVRTVTTTRHEIVPGVYGKVVVESRVNGVRIKMTEAFYCDPEDLTDAIQTLTAIRDAMQANTTA